MGQIQLSSGLGRSFVVVALVIIVVLVIMAKGAYTIETGTVGVVSTFGKYDPDEAQPGFHLKVPFIQTVHVLDTKLQTANYLGSQQRNAGPGVINNPRITVLDDKNLQIGLELTVQFIPIPDQADEILAKYGKNYYDKKLNAIIRNVVRDVAGQYQAETIAARRAELGNAVKTRLAKELEGLPFRLREVALRNILLPKVVTTKIEQVQQAKQEEQRLAMVKKQAEQEQKIKSTQAQTRLIEVTTQAKADAEKRKIEADAKAYSVLKEAEATAKANRLIAESLTTELVRYRAIEQWNGVMPSTLLGAGEDNPAANVLLNIKK